MEDSNLLQQKKFEILLEMQSKKHTAEMSNLKQYISSISSEINSLKSRISRLEIQKDTLKENYVDGAENEGDEESPARNSDKNPEPIRPRYGDYKPEDVSIDKFFYYGNKR